jgi:hypothetical protein
VDLPFLKVNDASQRYRCTVLNYAGKTLNTQLHAKFDKQKAAIMKLESQIFFRRLEIVSPGDHRVAVEILEGIS